MLVLLSNLAVAHNLWPPVFLSAAKLTHWYSPPSATPSNTFVVFSQAQPVAEASSLSAI